MRIDPGVCGDLRTRMLRTLLDCPHAEVYVLRLWCYATETQKWVWPRGTMVAEAVAAACEYMGDAAGFVQAMKTAGWLVQTDDTGWELADYAKVNAKSVANRENGRLGGRPRKTQQKPNENPTITQPKPNHNPTITQQKPNHNPTITQQKPNHNPTITQQKPTEHTDSGQNDPATHKLTETQLKPNHNPTITQPEPNSLPNEDSSIPSLIPPVSKETSPSGGSSRAKTVAQIHDEAVSEMRVPESLNTPEFGQVFREFAAACRDRRDYMTARSIEMMFRKLERHSVDTAIVALEDSIANRWKGVFPEKVGSRRPRAVSSRADERKSYRV